MILDTAEKRHAFWKNPENSGLSLDRYFDCRPLFYLDLVNVTRLIVETVGKYATPDMSILEIGCGTGRNLVGLYKAGFKNLAGIEINMEAVKLGRKTFPEYENINVVVAPVETVITDIPHFDVIYTQSCLMHLPMDLEWVIGVIRNKADKVIITTEGERPPSFNTWLHDYQKIVEATCEFEQVETHTCEAYTPLPKTTVKRVFLRKEVEPPPGEKKPVQKRKTKAIL